MRLFRASCVLALLVFFGFYLISSLLTLAAPSQQHFGSNPVASSSKIPAFDLSAADLSSRAAVDAFDYSKVPRRRKYALASSVQTAKYANYAATLGYSILKHNDVDALDIEMVLLIRTDGADGVTPQNITNLEKVGWTVRVAEELEFEEVKTSDIRPWHRHNFNKLHLWTWTQYEKVIFVDADVICKNPFADILHMPGDLAASADVWSNILVDNRFNSGVLVLRPNVDEFRLLSKAVSDPSMHKAREADQAFLNAFYKFRYYGMPFKYNLNLVMVAHHRPYWDALWDEAVFVHMTVKKPEPDKWCLFERNCAEWEVNKYYQQVNKEMHAFHGFKDLMVYG